MAARVTTVDNYDIYHASDVDMSESSPLPLISITTTIKEVIQFATYTDGNALPRRQVKYTEATVHFVTLSS